MLLHDTRGPRDSRRMRHALALLLFLPLFGCATLSETECRGGDWRAIGFADGVAGRDADFVENHAGACADLRIAPDKPAWEAGRQDGLAVYCTPLKAYIEGRNGIIVKRICPAPLQSRLLRENNRGLSARFALRDRRSGDLFDRIPNPGLFRAPRAILELPGGRDEYDVLRLEVNRLRADYPFPF